MFRIEDKFRAFFTDYSYLSPMNPGIYTPSSGRCSLTLTRLAMKYLRESGALIGHSHCLAGIIIGSLHRLQLILLDKATGIQRGFAKSRRNIAIE